MFKKLDGNLCVGLLRILYVKYFCNCLLCWLSEEFFSNVKCQYILKNSLFFLIFAVSSRYFRLITIREDENDIIPFHPTSYIYRISKCIVHNNSPLSTVASSLSERFKFDFRFDDLSRSSKGLTGYKKTNVSIKI